jgi:hypothetical protein
LESSAGGRRNLLLFRYGSRSPLRGQAYKERLGACFREPPIVINRGFVWAPIRMAANHNGPRTGIEQAANLLHCVNHLGIRFGRSDREHRKLGVIGQTDKNPLRSFLDFDMRRDLRLGSSI